MEEKIEQKLYSLSKSKFRSSFHLRKYMIDYINDKGMNKIKKHAYDFIRNKIGDANPKNDGKQTPMKNHPVFIAMHACGCCCRSCLNKWHLIDKYKDLDDEEIKYIVSLLMMWIRKEMLKYDKEI